MPMALESGGPYFEIMGQWPGPTVNLKRCVHVIKVPQCLPVSTIL